MDLRIYGKNINDKSHGFKVYKETSLFYFCNKNIKKFTF